MNAKFLTEEPEARVAAETFATTNRVVIGGEVGLSDQSKLTEYMGRIDEIARACIKDIGYEQDGFHWERLKVYNELHGQSPDIALGTDDFGAGDQGIMFGYACNETPNNMPSAIYYSHEILKALETARTNGATWLGPDSKAQVTYYYDSIGKPMYIKSIVCSTQHSDDLSIEEVRERVTDIILPVVKDQIHVLKTVWHINPTGRFVIGGPDGDTGLTGRKIIVDTYGGWAPHGGGAFSGKDPTKVDRSAAYMARWLAKNVVASEMADWCQIQLSYAIGVKEPTSIYVESNGHNRSIEKFIRSNVDLTPLGIIDRFDLFKYTNYSENCVYGHFGNKNVPWEKIGWE